MGGADGRREAIDTGRFNEFNAFFDWNQFALHVTADAILNPLYCFELTFNSGSKLLSEMNDLGGLAQILVVRQIGRIEEG